MDPLSVAASVAGLLAVGGKIISILSEVSRLSDAPPLCKATITELTDISIALKHVQAFITNPKAVPEERRQLVLLEHLAASLMGCVLTKDELETICDDLGSVYTSGGIAGTFDRLRWIRREEEIESLVGRLQNHKSSLNLMLTVFQCNSLSQLQESIDQQHGLLEQALCNNAALSARVSCLSEGEDAISGTVIEPVNDDISVETIIRIQPPMTDPNHNPHAAMAFEFDPLLQESFVYKKLQEIEADGHSETSATNSRRQRMAAAIFSIRSLADISNISAYSLPIMIKDVRNSGWYAPTSESLFLSPRAQYQTIRDFIFNFAAIVEIGSDPLFAASLVYPAVSMLSTAGRVMARVTIQSRLLAMVSRTVRKGYNMNREFKIQLQCISSIKKLPDGRERLQFLDDNWEPLLRAVAGNIDMDSDVVLRRRCRHKPIRARYLQLKLKEMRLNGEVQWNG